MEKWYFLKNPTLLDLNINVFGNRKKNNGFGFGNGPFFLTWVHLKGSVLFEALTTLYPHLTLSGGDCLKFQPEHNLVTCLAHLEYRGLHCIVLQLLDTNIRQVGAVLMLEMRWGQWWRWTWWSWCDVDDYYIIIIFLIVTTVFTKVIYKNGRRGLSPWATNKFGNDLLVALQTLHKVSW